MKKLLNFLAEMNIGDTAEFLESPYANIRREEDGYYWVSGSGNYNKGSKEDSIFKLAKIGHLIRYELKILPKYVSFLEAMKALEEGKMVRVKLSYGYSEFTKEADVEPFYNATWKQLIEGKWTIEE